MLSAFVGYVCYKLPMWIFMWQMLVTPEVPRVDVERTLRGADEVHLLPEERRRILRSALSQLWDAAVCDPWLQDRDVERMILGIMDREKQLPPTMPKMSVDDLAICIQLEDVGRGARLLTLAIQKGVVVFPAEAGDAGGGVLAWFVEELEASPRGKAADSVKRLTLAALRHGADSGAFSRKEREMDMLLIAVKTRDIAYLRALVEHGICPRDQAHAAMLEKVARDEECIDIEEYIRTLRGAVHHG